MKLRYLFSIVLSSLILFAGCVKEATVADSFGNIKLSSTYLSISENGGNVSVKINSTEAWAFVETDNWPNVIERDDDGNIKKSTPSWLKADKMSGSAGETQVTFSAEAFPGREAELMIKAGNNTQFLRVRQGSLAPVTATCKEVIAGPEGKSYIVKGVCTAISNTVYGNWYLNDGTGEIYIYGTVDGDGKYNWSDFNIEVGDIVTVQGSYVLYGGSTPEFVDASFISVEKSLIKIVSESEPVAKDGGEIEVKLAYKGNGVFPTIPDEYRDWVSVVDMNYAAGVPSKIEPNPADTAFVKVLVQANPAGPREGSIKFASSNADGASSVDFKIEQDGALLQIADGLYWLIANNSGSYVAASAVPADKGYGYLPVAEATATSAPGASAFIFRAVEGGYTIQDLSGRYYYQKGTYNNFNVSTTLPESGHIFILMGNEDGTVKIQNVAVKKYIQYDAGYNSWGSYDSAKGPLPALVAAVAPVVADGKYYIEVSAGVATPVTKSYGYINVAAKAPENAFTFTYTEGQGYTICDENGNYYYQKGTYNSFNLDANPTEGQYWSIFPLADGTVKITNLSVNKWWQYSTSYSSFGSYDSAQSGAELPKLVPVQ